VALQLKEMGFNNVSCLKGGYREWVKAQWPVEQVGGAAKKECITCHSDVTPGIVADWKVSKHAQHEVTCAVCHGDHHASPEDADKVLPINPDRCGMCHQIQADQFKHGKHSLAWSTLKAMPTAHWQTLTRTEGTRGCESCHRLGYKTQAEIVALKKSGAGFGYVSCDVCHTRHTFSKKEAQQPQACQTCHMGFDHPQYEMWSASKHGVRYLLKQNGILPESATAPTCQTCHMQEGSHAVRTAWGFLAVRLPMPADSEWADARKMILQALGVLDPKGKPTARLDLVGNADIVRLTQEDWLSERIKMIKTCNTCHSANFVLTELDKGDQMIRRTDLLLADGIRVVAGLYKDGVLKKPASYAHLFPDFLSFHDAPTTIDLKLWRMFMEYRMRAFQGVFHASPVYAQWYGWGEMQQSLTELKEMATALRRKEGPAKKASLRKPK
jgi:hydroxylamine dehydrogenase